MTLFVTNKSYPRLVYLKLNVEDCACVYTLTSRDKKTLVRSLLFKYMNTCFIWNLFRKQFKVYNDIFDMFTFDENSCHIL